MKMYRIFFHSQEVAESKLRELQLAYPNIIKAHIEKETDSVSKKTVYVLYWALIKGNQTL